MFMTIRTKATLVALLLLGTAPVAVQAQSTPEGVPPASVTRQKQIAFEKTIPMLDVTEQVINFHIPDMTMGETMGVSTNSKGHLFVYSRTNPQGIARGGQAAMLFEFDQNYKYVKLWGPHNYAASFAHSVRVDKNDNVWMIDEGSDMIVEFDPSAEPIAEYGRTPEAIDYLEETIEKKGRGYSDAGAGKPVDYIENLHPKGRMGEFNRPTDVTWDSKGNLYASDGYGNSRVVKITPGGKWVKSVGTWGAGDNQFNIVHSMAADKNDVIYAADRNNSRIQVYDTDLNFQKSITGVGMPWGICITPASAGKQYLYSGDGTTGKIYKVDLDSGKVLGWAQTSMGHGEDDTGRLIHEITCVAPNEIILGSGVVWSVTKVTIKG